VGLVVAVGGRAWGSTGIKTSAGVIVGSAVLVFVGDRVLILLGRGDGVEVWVGSGKLSPLFTWVKLKLQSVPVSAKPVVQSRRVIQMGFL
jgi:hypothetical protein